MVTSREKIKEWFKTGAKPTQEQFYDWIDSYWHKYDDVSGILNQMQGATYMGEAHPDDVPPVTKQKVFYTATSAGTYTNFAGAVLASGEKAILLYDKAWSKITLSEIAQELGDSKDVAVSQKVVQSEIKRINNAIKEQVVQDFGQNTAKAISQKVVTERFGEVETLAKTKVAKQQSAGQGNVVMFGEGGEVADSGIEASNVAKQNGYYESMIVGASKNLAGNNIVTAKYTYRPTADTTDVADGVAKISSVKGNTIVWNQRCGNTSVLASQNNGVSVTTLNGVISLNGTLNSTFANLAYAHLGFGVINLNHIGYYKCTIVKDLNNVLQNKKFGLLNRGCNTKIVGSTASFIYKNTDDSLAWSFGFLGFAVGDVFYDVQIKVNVFDLTQMFGEGNEPTIEEFEAMFPNDYYEYNEGELKSIEDFSIKSVGFNQWDEEWELGTIGTAKGNPAESSSMIRSVNFIKVLPNTKYRYTFTQITTRVLASYIYFYDDDYKFISFVSSTPNYGGNYNGIINFTTPKNCTYIKFVEQHTTVIDDTHRACINLSHSGIRDGEYEPYREDILPINISSIKDENGEQLFPNGLCSAGEAHDKLVYDKSLGKWKAVKRIGSVDMGTLEWVYNTDYNGFNSIKRFPSNIESNSYFKGLSVKYPYKGSYSNVKDKEMGALYYDCIIIKDSSYTDAETFKASLQGQMLYYVLAEPIEVVLDDFTSNYKVSDWGTEEILMSSTPIVPVIYDVEYALNAVDTLRNMPTNYISKESLDAFLSTLGSAMGGTWTATFNETNSRYDFTFSANASATELIDE